MKTFLLTIILFLIGLYSVGQIHDTVYVLPGEGIILNSDTILLGNDSYIELANELDNSEISKLHIMYLVDCIDLSYPMIRSIDYDSIYFEFSSCGDSINMRLSKIIVTESDKFATYLTNDIFIGSSDSIVENLYKKGVLDRISKTTQASYYFYPSRGIWIKSKNGIIYSFIIMLKN